MLAQWEVKTLQSYIDNQIEENLNLDYKAADALQKSDGKKKEISKDVSAMANAAGGLIIYGIKEFDDSSKRHRPEKIDPINRTEISKEWLEQVINSNIQPRIEGLLITPITIDETAATVAYVVEVPQSATAHQASDKRYYKRYNFESVPMEDYEIRDVMSRLKHPKVALEFSLERKHQEERDPITGGPKVSFFYQNKTPKKWLEYRLKVAIRNKGKIFANYVNYYLELPTEILHADENHLEDSKNNLGYKIFYGENTVRDVVDVQPVIGTFIKKYGPSRFDPVLPGMRSRYETIRLIDDNTNWNKELNWVIYADNAEPETSIINLSEIVKNINDV